MEKPIINEVFDDNGKHLFWELLSAETGELLWNEDVNDYIPTDETIEEVLKHIPKYFTFDKASGNLYNHNSQSYEGIDGDTVVYTTYVKGKKRKLKGVVKGYTNYQIVTTYEYGTDILTSENVQSKEIIKNKKWIK